MSHFHSSTLQLEGNDSLYPIAVLIDELKNEDMQLRLNSIKRLGTIATALGPERTRSELLPFLNENIDDEDEVLLALAEQLGNFIDSVGGPKYAFCLLDLLETLAAVEETVVREKAVESLNKIVDVMAEAGQTDDVLKYFVPLVKRLAKGDWFTSRISATGLFHSAYRHIPRNNQTLKDELRNLFKELAQDETPMVRRALASKLSKFASVVEVKYVEDELIPIFVRLAGDEQDSVRLLAVENCAVLAKLSPVKSEVREEYLIPIARELAADKSWRVRFMFADKICELAEGLGFDATVKELAPSFYKLMEDCEAEVRTAAAFKIASFFETISRLDENMTDSSSVVSEVFEKLYSYSRDLSLDDSPFVRSALASNIMSVAPIVGPEITRDTLLRMFLKLLQDDFSEVRLNIIGSLEKVSQVIGIEKLASDLLPSIVELSEDRNWRIRYAAIELTPTLARQLGKSYFESDKKLGMLCVQWLSDTVYSVRELAIKNLTSLTELFGEEWAIEHVLPAIVALYKNSKNYLYRMTALHAMSSLSSKVPQEVVEQLFLPLLVEQACRDSVANIRFVAAKTLQDVAQYIKKETRSNLIIPCLEKLNNNMDEDSDVRYYANQALIALQSLV
ncbi:Serine/threonine-protein phosphatase 2A 65 kDa regulatory subunit A alpha isoform [Galdieria sulphuraria]|nr:Serine/threonine-protein phosphatase 2A 65 kDa regulatory subunit A alpha isoform [Galdieria sulphuraria]